MRHRGQIDAGKRYRFAVDADFERAVFDRCKTVEFLFSGRERFAVQCAGRGRARPSANAQLRRLRRLRKEQRRRFVFRRIDPEILRDAPRISSAPKLRVGAATGIITSSTWTISLTESPLDINRSPFAKIKKPAQRRRWKNQIWYVQRSGMRAVTFNPESARSSICADFRFRIGYARTTRRRKVSARS